MKNKFNTLFQHHYYLLLIYKEEKMYNQNNICSLEQILKEYPTVEIFENKEYKTTRRTQRRGYLENMEFETTEADMARLFANEKRKLIKVWLDSNDNIIRWVFKGESGINPTPREMTSEEISDLHRAIKKCINFRSDNNTCKATNYDDVIHVEACYTIMTMT